MATRRDRVAVIGSSETQVREVLASVERFVVAAPDVELLDVETAWLEQLVTSPRKFPRTRCVNEVMLEVLADELERMSDPRLELVTFTGVKVTRDLALRDRLLLDAGCDRGRRAGVVRRRRGRRRCAHAAPHLRSLVGRQMRIRQVPNLTFEVDPGIVAGQRIDEILPRHPPRTRRTGSGW